MDSLETLKIVPLPAANPVAPYSIFHTVSVPVEIQAKSALVEVTLLAVKAVGSGHDGNSPNGASIARSSENAQVDGSSENANRTCTIEVYALKLTFQLPSISISSI